MEEQRALNRARSLFGVEAIPSDGQMRNVLDAVDPSYLRAPFWEIYERLQAGNHLDDYESIGIGLAVVKKIIELSGGKIWIESEVDRGSTFYFTLPKPENTL